MALNGPDPHWRPPELSGRQAVHLDSEATHRGVAHNHQNFFFSKVRKISLEMPHQCLEVH